VDHLLGIAIILIFAAVIVLLTIGRRRK